MEWVKHCLTLVRERQQSKVKRERKCKSFCLIPSAGEGSSRCCHSYSPAKPHRDEEHERLSQASPSSLIAIVPRHFLSCFPLLPRAAGQKTKVRSFPHYQMSNTFTTECVFQAMPAVGWLIFLGLNFGMNSSLWDHKGLARRSSCDLLFTPRWPALVERDA